MNKIKHHITTGLVAILITTSPLSYTATPRSVDNNKTLPNCSALYEKLNDLNKAKQGLYSTDKVELKFLFANEIEEANKYFRTVFSNQIVDQNFERQVEETCGPNLNSITPYLRK